MRSATTDSRQDATWNFLRFWAAFILLLSVAPYFIASARTPPGYSYDWMIPPYPTDAYAYRAWARQAADGLWLFSLKFTALPNPRALFLPFFLLAGKLAWLTGADTGIVFLVLKSAGVLLFFEALYAWLERLRFTPFQTVAAAVLVGISAGIGAFAPLIFGRLPLSWTPVDAWIVDSNTFWSLLWNPLYPFSLALMLTAVRLADESSSSGDARAAWLCGLCLGAEALLHPYPLVVLYPLTAALFAVRRPRGWSLLWLRTLAASLPATAYVAAVALLDPALRAHNALSTQEAPSMFACLSGFGLPLALAVAGAFAAPNGFLRRRWPLAAWFALSVALTMCPFWFQTKYLFGAHLPICLLAAAGAEPLLERLARSRSVRIALAAGFAALLPWTNVGHLVKSSLGARGAESGAYYLSDSRLDALDFLARNTRRDEVVFADTLSSAQIAAFAGNTVLWGHWAQSVDFDERQAWMKRVFAPESGLTPEERRKAFWDSGVSYAFLAGSWRAGFESASNAAVLAGATKVFENPAVAIYRRGDDVTPFLKPTSHSSNSATTAGSPTSRR